MLFNRMHFVVVLYVLLCVPLFLLPEVQAAGSVGAAAEEAAEVGVAESRAVEGLANNEFDKVGEESLEGRDEVEGAVAPVPTPKADDFADLLLLERELGGQFLDENQRVKAKLNKLKSKILWSLLSVVVCIVLLEAVFRLYLKPATDEIRAARKLNNPGGKERGEDLLPVVAFLASPPVILLTLLLIVVLNINIFGLFSKVLSYEFLSVDQHFKLEQEEYEEELKQEEEEEKRRQARVSQQSGTDAAVDQKAADVEENEPTGEGK
ncbi:hypothetical protein ACSSS7_003179 [Eimeria intestinalis]